MKMLILNQDCLSVAKISRDDEDKIEEYLLFEAIPSGGESEDEQEPKMIQLYQNHTL